MKIKLTPLNDDIAIDVARSRVIYTFIIYIHEICYNQIYLSLSLYLYVYIAISLYIYFYIVRNVSSSHITIRVQNSEPKNGCSAFTTSPTIASAALAESK